MDHRFDNALLALLLLALAFIVHESGVDPIVATVAAIVAVMGCAAVSWRSVVESSARKETGARLDAQAELLRATLAHIDDAVIACDAAARVTFMNPAAETLTRWPAARAVGVPVADVVRVVDSA